MNVFIVWNAYSILQFMLSIDNYKEFYITIDLDYNKNDDNDIRKLCEILLENKIIKGIISSDELFENSYDTIICMAYINDYLYDILQKVDYNKLILLEEGIYNYLNPKIEEKYIKLHNEAILFVNDTKNVSNKELFKEIKRIKKDQNILEEYINALNYNNLPDNIDIVFFTSPIDIDFEYKDYKRDVIKYLEDKYSGKRILIKNHPRDHLRYDSPLYETFYVDFGMPGQIISKKYDCEKVYAYASTVILSEDNVNNILILQLKNIKKEKYLNAFNHKKIQQRKAI